MAVLLALLSACATAVNLVLQRDSSRDAPPEVRGWRLLPYLVRNPRWLLGQGVWAIAFGLQALALHLGRLSVVQPVLVTQLVFTLLIRRYASRWPVRPAAWGSAGLLCGSLGLFLVAAEPRGGHPVATSSAWVWALLTCGGVAAVAAFLGRTGSPQRRAGCFAVAASMLAAVEATLVKEAMETLSTRGLLVLLSGWPVYVLVTVGTASGLLVQAALHVGPLTVSQPLLVVVNPLTSIALSVWLFGEHFAGTAAALVLGACSFLGLIAGVFLLTATGPRGPRPQRVRPSGGRLPRLDAVRPHTAGGTMTDTAQNTADNALDRVAQGDTPVLDTVFAMHLDALERSGLDERTYVLTRLAALVALDAPPVSYGMTIGIAADAGVTVEDAQAVLVAIAPLVGTARITAAAGNVVRAIVGAAALAESVVPEPRTS